MKPDKGRWGLLFGCCGLAASAIGICGNSLGVFYTPVAEELHLLRGSVAMNATISSIATAVTALFIPQIMNHRNARKLIATGALAAAISTMLMGMIHSLTVYYLLSVIRGIGNGCYGMVVINLLVAGWFKNNNGTATGIAMSFSGLSGAVFSVWFSSLIEQIGWRWSYVVMGAAIFLLVVPALVQPFPELLLDGSGEKSDEKEQQGGDHVVFVMGSCLFLVALFHTAITSMTQHFPGYAESIGLASGVGAIMLSASMIGNIVSKFVIGILSDRLGAIKASLGMIGAAVAFSAIGFVYDICGSYLPVLVGWLVIHAVDLTLIGIAVKKHKAVLQS